MKRLFLMALVVSVCTGGVIAVSNVAAKDDQGISQQLQILNGKVDQIQQSLTTIQNSLITGPAWYQILASAQRFLSVMGGPAILDLETGLVWEQSPSTDPFNWFEAINHCNREVKTGGRNGWRLPTIWELASLVDPNAVSDPALPSGHPFSNVQQQRYWSATTLAGNTDDAWQVLFELHGVVNFLEKASSAQVWCVRGGQGPDPQ